MYFPVLSILPNIGFLDLLQRIMTIHLLNARGQINEVFTEEKNSNCLSHLIGNVFCLSPLDLYVMKYNLYFIKF